MNTTLAQGISEQTIERLLKSRPCYSRPEVCDELEQIALVLEGVADPLQTRLAHEHLQSCGECASAVMLLSGALSQGELDPPAPTRIQPRSAIARPAVWAAAAAVVISFAAFFFWQQTEQGDQGIPSTMAIKGETDQLSIAVQRGTSRFVVQPGDRLVTGDQLGLFYSAETPGYLAVFCVDANSETALLFPNQGTLSESIAQGTEVPLPDGAYVAEGSGTEWIVAVFSDQPMIIDELEGQIQRAHASRGDQSFELDLPGARTVFLSPFVR